MTTTSPLFGQLLTANRDAILEEWVRLQALSGDGRAGITVAEMREQSRELLAAIESALREGAPQDNISTSEWARVREFLSRLSATRARQGATPVETATFVLSLKQALVPFLRTGAEGDTELEVEETWNMTLLLDRLALWTTEVHQKSREEIILRQQQELLELSTPVVRLWDGVLALPLIGTLDSARTQVVMESLLQEIVTTGAQIAIIDITGVPTVDTLVAQHLLKTVAAARLMGADCIISGIRPQIAQTIVHLGVELNDVITKATLADAFTIALQRSGLTVVRRESTRRA